MIYSDLEVSGYSDRNGKRFIRVSYGNANAFLPLELFNGKGEEALRMLTARNLVLPGASAGKKLLERVYFVTEFEQADMITIPGYANGRFTLADGSVFGSDADQVKVAFTVNRLMCSEAGTIQEWRDQIAASLTGQHIPMMSVLLAFAAPLAAVTGRSMCRSIEFVGAPSSSIGILPLLLASVAGAPTWQLIQFAQLASGRGDMLPYHNDLAVPVLGGDVLLAGEKPARRAAAIKNYLFPDHLGETHRAERAARPGCLVSFSNAPLLELDDGLSEFSSLAAGQHISIRVASDRPYGVFDKLPNRCPGSAALATRLADRVNEHHGIPLRYFLAHLIEETSHGSAALNGLVQRRVSAFRKAAASDPNDRGARVITDTFAMAYAAGWIARDIGILPPAWRIGPSVMRCHRNELFRTEVPPSLSDILDQLAAGPGVIELGGHETQAGPFDDHNIFVRRRERGNELLIRPSAIDAVFPDWKTLVRTPSAKNVMVTEKGHLAVKRRLGTGGPQRVFCFKLAPPE